MTTRRLSELELLEFGNTIQMAGAVYQGDGQLFIALFPEDQGALDDADGRYTFLPRGVQRRDEGGQHVVTLEMDLDDWTRLLRQTDLLETEVLAQAANGALTKTILRKSQRQISQGVSWAVYKRDGYRCRYCGNDDVPLTVDHLVLWEAGGPSIEANLVAACRRCNKARGNTEYAAWLEHPHYLRVSSNLDPATRRANQELAATLGAIPRMVHKPSHR
jgi:hypothetical protein